MKIVSEPLLSTALSAAVSQTQPAVDAAAVNLTEKLKCGNVSSLILEDILSFSGASVLNRVPKGARNQTAAALSCVINNVCESDSPSEWQKLFRFSFVCFKNPKEAVNTDPL